MQDQDKIKIAEDLLLKCYAELLRVQKNNVKPSQKIFDEVKKYFFIK